MDLDEYQRAVNLLSTSDMSEAKSALIQQLNSAEPNAAHDNNDNHDDPSLTPHCASLQEQLLQLAESASAQGLRLSEVASRSLVALNGSDTGDRKLPTAREPGLPLDSEFPAEERFPRSMRFVFTEHNDPSGRAYVHLRIDAATPNPFPDGPVQRHGKVAGFGLGDAVGAPLSDNSLTQDGYRYHDAIHIAFAAVLGWSPVLRSLLSLKRRSDARVDDAEDGARAIFTEEGIAAILAQRAKLRSNFTDDRAVDFTTLQIVKEVTADLEIAQCPNWRWKLAIASAFECMSRLQASRGGVLTANLDKMTLRFEASRKGLNVTR